MTQFANISFVDRESGDEGLIIVKAAGDTVGLTLSLLRNGDIEVFIGLAEVRQLVAALKQVEEMMDGTS